MCRRQNLSDAIRQDEKVDRKIARNQDKFEALDFNAAVGDSRMTPASAFVATIRGKLPPPPPPHGCHSDQNLKTHPLL